MRLCCAAPDDDPAADPRAAAAGLLSVLNLLATTSPLLLAIDDFQWLDEPTRRMVGYATRRCRGPIAVLTTERAHPTPDSTRELCPPDPTRLYRHHLGPLSLGASHHVVRQETGRSFARPMMVRIAEGSAGNPFFAVEMARSLTLAGPGAGSFPAGLRQLGTRPDRIAGPAVCEALLVASAVAEPRVELIAVACGVADVVELLAPAEDSGLIGLSAGLVRFTHPLWASGVYHEASPARRRRLHRLLSELVEDVEERARHLALAATGPAANTISALEMAADHARRRGAVSAAAELLEMAIGLGVPEQSLHVQAARDYFDADDPARARELLEAVIADAGPGVQRAEALGLLGTIVYAVEDYGRAVATLEGAFAEAGGDSRLRCSIAMELCTALPNMGLATSALRYAAIAVQEAEKVADDGLLAEALACRVMVRFLTGHGVDEDTLSRGPGARRPGTSKPRTALAVTDSGDGAPLEPSGRPGQNRTCSPPSEMRGTRRRERPLVRPCLCDPCRSVVRGSRNGRKLRRRNERARPHDRQWADLGVDVRRASYRRGVAGATQGGTRRHQGCDGVSGRLTIRWRVAVRVGGPRHGRAIRRRSCRRHRSTGASGRGHHGDGFRGAGIRHLPA